MDNDEQPAALPRAVAADQVSAVSAALRGEDASGEERHPGSLSKTGEGSLSDNPEISEKILENPADSPWAVFADFEVAFERA